jgi:glucose-6-phosphate 1-dehydrogenase
VQPIINVWKEEGARDLPIYRAGSSGPKEANRLLLRDGYRWRTI